MTDLLQIENLVVSFSTLRGELQAIDRISLNLKQGETLGIVGESGCGKSITSLAIMGLLPSNATVAATRFAFEGQDLLTMPERQRRKLRGAAVSMIFQDPMSALNPSFTVGYQLMEVIKTHEGGRKSAHKARALDLLKKVGIPDPASVLEAYPHQLSGGMSQRVMIASAISCRPKLLIADEPTTALDVTIQAQILDLLKDLQEQEKMALILITHDLGVVAEMAQRVAVMYAGQIVETGVTSEVIKKPTHPYTEGLLRCLPAAQQDHSKKTRLSSIPGLVPDLVSRPKGCQLNPRCRYVIDVCRTMEPGMTQPLPMRQVRCHTPLNGVQA